MCIYLLFCIYLYRIFSMWNKVLVGLHDFSFLHFVQSRATSWFYLFRDHFDLKNTIIMHGLIKVIKLTCDLLNWHRLSQTSPLNLCILSMNTVLIMRSLSSSFDLYILIHHSCSKWIRFIGIMQSMWVGNYGNLR